jgi:2-polyprenyl-6-methoxyphenol hydroxylase-like FAD-dependent oxidoreductase
MADAPVLIAGAGPTGLAAALFLAELGVNSRIVDPAPAAALTSKALAVNPRSLELLKPTGVADRILAEGRSVQRMQLRGEHGQLLATIPVNVLPGPFPMVALPQSRTEALLAQALAQHGLHPEREVALETVRDTDGFVEVGLRHADGSLESTRAAIVLGADGAHSATRRALDIGFPGSALAEPWNLADVTLNAPVSDTEGYVQFLPHHRMVFALAFTPERWRVIAAGARALDHLPDGRSAKAVEWESDFKISHRIADRLNVGRVCLAGDAAHLHSPMGARGMNLGIEDAWVFAQLAKRALDSGSTDPLAAYGRLRREADAGVVRRVKFGTETVLGYGLAGRLRGLLLPVVTRVPAARMLAMRLVAGLDHPVRLD